MEVKGKNRGYMPSSLGSSLIVVVRQAGRQACKLADENLAVGKIFKLDNFNLKHI